MKDLIKKVLVEHLLTEGDHPSLYDKYEFDSAKVSHYKTGSNVFLNNSVNIVDSIYGDVEFIENTDKTIPFTTLIHRGQEYRIPQWDKNDKQILKISSTGDLYLSLKDFQNYFKGYDLENSDMDSDDIVARIKNEKLFLSTLNNIMENIYSNLKNDDGEPLFGESVKDDKCKTNRGVINFRGVKYGVGYKLISNWSILNYFNTNTGIIKFLLKEYMGVTGIKTSDFTQNFKKEQSNFINWIEKNQDNLFGPESQYLDKMEKINLKSLNSGIQREQVAIRILMKIHNVGEEGITEYCPGSIEDTKYGRDVKINLEEELYYQIKPLNGEVNKTKNGYLVPTNGMKKYPKTVQRFIFVGKDGKYVIFQNDSYEISEKGDFVTFKNKPIEQN